MSKLVCKICGTERDVPICCDKSMMVRDEFLCCCQNENCGYEPIPECCGQKMDYISA